ncbi:hypothetical protein POTOM_056905 [Populus tomentosa]|uniref:Complex III subunit VII n=1 Tax=Populus tomentosa TaxID=118781 RepID=A0A8X8C2Y6_POPTO|nr:hypothetical protein POTOM_056905 [Populus tomentosa]
MASFLQSLIDPRKNWLAKQHMKTLSSRLRRYGLRYDDLYDPYYEPDIKEALNRLPREIVDARNQRLKRALDLSMKHDFIQFAAGPLLNDMGCSVKQFGARAAALTCEEGESRTCWQRESRSGMNVLAWLLDGHIANGYNSLPPFLKKGCWGDSNGFK